MTKVEQLKKVAVWKEWCKKCNTFHLTSLQQCPSCGIYYTPQPHSEKVKEKHLLSIYHCDGCEAYQDHLK
jgi:hypothetical protein